MSRALTIITAADEAYGRCLYQFLRSAKRLNIPAGAQIMVYDMGLAAQSRARLMRQFPFAQWRNFDFAQYPSHIGLASRTYGWKPLLIWEAAQGCKGDLLWLDCAALFKTRDLSELRQSLRRDGVYALKGASALALRCNRFTLDALDVPVAERARPERVATVIGFDLDHPAIQDLLEDWRRHALIPAHIAPRTPHHNPEQALLSILLFRYQRQGRLGLGEGEIDISSPRPFRWLSTRNKVAAWVPEWADPICRFYYFAYKTGDQAWLRLQQWRALRQMRTKRPIDKGSPAA